VLHRIVKIGKPGHVTDNEWTGSSTVGLNQDGSYRSYCTDKAGNKCDEVNGIKISELSPNPYVRNVDAAAIEIASKMFYSRVLGMDFAIDSDGNVIFLELNHSYNGIRFYQHNNGPLFGEFTNEVLQYCREAEGDRPILY